MKRRQAQIYPLLPSVAEALARYIDTVRPQIAHSEVFIRLQAPWGPITPGTIYNIVNRRFTALGIDVAHLGHRSTSATQIYAKVDMRSLREVGDFDLGALQ